MGFELGPSEILEVTTILATWLSSGHLFQQIGVGSSGVFLEAILVERKGGRGPLMSGFRGEDKINFRHLLWCQAPGEEEGGVWHSECCLWANRNGNNQRRACKDSTFLLGPPS